MDRSIQQKLERARRYWILGHPFEKAALISLGVLVVLLVVAITTVIPHANSVSIHAGLTVIAEILGVLIGALLIVIVLMIEQLRQADNILKNAMPKYLHLMSTKKQIIDTLRGLMIKWLSKNKPSGIDPETDANIIQAISDMATLSVAINDDYETVIWNELLDIGFPDGEITYIVRNRRMSVTHDAYEFLNLLRISFGSIQVAIMTDRNLTKVKDEVLREFSKEGIFDALDRYKMSEDFLKSTALAFSLSLTSITLVVAILAIFGTTEISIKETQTMVLVNSIIVAFLLSLIFTAFSIRKIFSLGQ